MIRREVRVRGAVHFLRDSASTAMLCRTIVIQPASTHAIELFVPSTPLDGGHHLRRPRTTLQNYHCWATRWRPRAETPIRNRMKALHSHVVCARCLVPTTLKACLGPQEWIPPWVGGCSTITVNTTTTKACSPWDMSVGSENTEDPGGWSNDDSLRCMMNKARKHHLAAETNSENTSASWCHVWLQSSSVGSQRFNRVIHVDARLAVGFEFSNP